MNLPSPAARISLGLAALLLPVAFALAQSSSYTNVRVVGPVTVTSDGGLGVVLPSGTTVSLASESIADLTAPQCGAIFPLEKLHLAPGISPIPPLLADGGVGGEPTRSSITIVNTDTSNARTVACDLQALDGGFPGCTSSAGHGELLHNQDRFTWAVGAARQIYCVPCNAAGVDIGWREESCR